MKHQSTMIIAHRGESFDAPENTMAAIQLAWDRGADAVEIDIQLSKDNRIVVIHDFETKRLAGVNKKVKEQTFEELRKLDVGSWKNPAFKDEKIPSLAEVLESVPNGKKLIIEIKSDSSIIPIFKKDLEESKPDFSQAEIIGFDLKTVSQAKKVFPDRKVLWLLNLDYYFINRVFRPSVSKAIKKAKENKLDGLNVWAGKMLTPSLIKEVHEADLLLYCWTVNDPQKAQKLWDLGIDGITTDRAIWIKSQLNADAK